METYYKLNLTIPVPDQLLMNLEEHCDALEQLLVTNLCIVVKIVPAVIKEVTIQESPATYNVLPFATE